MWDSDNAASRHHPRNQNPTNALARLAPAAPLLPATLDPAELDAVRSFAEAEKAASTAPPMIGTGGFSPAGAPPGGSSLCRPSRPLWPRSWPLKRIGGAKASTISRRTAAIRYAHKLAGISEPPTNSELVRATMRGIRRTIGAAPEKKQAATADVLGQMSQHCHSSTLIGVRDRARLALGFGGAFRRSELVALRWKT